MHKILLSIILLVSGCAYTVKVTDGDTAMDRYQFDRAIAFYEKDLARARSRVQQGRIALKLAECHSRQNNPARALAYYETAWNSQAGVAALRGKAYSLKMLERYEEAIETFEQLGEEIGSTYEYRRDIQSCNLAMAWMKQSSGMEAESLPINSAASDYAAAFLPDGIVAFTSDRGALAKDKDRYLWTGKAFSDILATDSTGQNLGKLPNELASLINSPVHEGNLVMDPSGTHLYFTRCGGGDRGSDQYCRIYGSSRENGSWRVPEPLSFCSGNFNYGHAWPSADGSSLIFSADDPHGIGGYDLYRVDRSDTGWSEPQILPPTINTPGDEMFPMLDGEFLYFASDHHPGMGGLDIFRSRRTGPRNWTVPENLMPPINSGADDFAFVPAREPGTGREGRGPAWFSSSRPGGKGGDDLYELRKTTARTYRGPRANRKTGDQLFPGCFCPDADLSGPG
jgi:peptidoglycan-associated lipoprotein